ncbi:hypothetical protein [Curtobacterium sp. MCBD17_040]|uniref:hypothetical protein n=1 Tax=Curtobacterium sp. MCBD17_040 TaxID=2175674 RepID=UPI000DA8ECDA|nr:hypothetical protein [Curtobacterium sp. MCBD17_040]WIB65554.1 hypothetical protein DEI94_19460 [Curtobacterium sp. MCBD17_040]
MDGDVVGLATYAFVLVCAGAGGMWARHRRFRSSDAAAPQLWEAPERPEPQLDVPYVQQLCRRILLAATDPQERALLPQLDHMIAVTLIGEDCVSVTVDVTRATRATVQDGPLDVVGFAAGAIAGQGVTLWVADGLLTVVELPFSTSGGVVKRPNLGSLTAGVPGDGPDTLTALREAALLTDFAPLHPSALPMLAAHALVAGADSQSLAYLAGLPASENPTRLSEHFAAAVEELRLTPDRSTALGQRSFIDSMVTMLLSGRLAAEPFTAAMASVPHELLTPALEHTGWLSTWFDPEWEDDVETLQVILDAAEEWAALPPEERAAR